MLNNRKQPVMKGEVKMPIEDYNNIILELEMYRKAISLNKESWDNSVEIRIDTKVFLPLILDELKHDYPDYELTDYASDLCTKTIARQLAKKEENEDEC